MCKYCRRNFACCLIKYFVVYLLYYKILFCCLDVNLPFEHKEIDIKKIYKNVKCVNIKNNDIEGNVVFFACIVKLIWNK